METPAPATPAPAPASTHEKLYDTRVYGYLNSYLEQIEPMTLARPFAYDRATGQVRKDEEPLGFGIDAFVMVQGTIGHRYRYFLNIAALDAGDPVENAHIELRNAWVEASLYGQALAVLADGEERQCIIDGQREVEAVLDDGERRRPIIDDRRDTEFAIRSDRLARRAIPDAKHSIEVQSDDSLSLAGPARHHDIVVLEGSQRASGLHVVNANAV